MVTPEGQAAVVVLWGRSGRGMLEELTNLLETERYRVEIRDSDAFPRSSDDGTSTDEAWVYLAAERGGGLKPDLEDAEAVLRAWAQAAVPRLVVVASAAIWEPNWHHPGLVSEGAAKTVRTRNPIARCWRELELLVDQIAASAEREVVILRPAPTVSGTDPGFWSRLLSPPLSAVVAGHDPPVQLLTAEELARAVLAAVRGDVRGTVHVAPPDAVPLRRVLAAAGVRAVSLPRWMLALGCSLGCRFGLTPPPAQIDYLRYSWTVSPDELTRVAAFVPRGTLPTAVQIGAGDEAEEMSPGEDAGEEPRDAWGLDRDFIDGCSRILLGSLERRYWRVESSGLRNVPLSGPVVLVGVHRGFMPFDAVMALHLLAGRTGRYPRFLIHPGLIKFPFLHDFFIRLGGVIACRDNADRLLEQGEMVGVLPEGVHGPFRLHRDAYRVGNPWRADFVRFALRHRAPILPWITLGTAEMLPIVKRLDWRWWKRWTEWPFLPVTATVLPIPLPSKWHTRFLPAIDLADSYPSAKAEDHRLVEEISRDVRSLLQTELSEMVTERRSVFFGSLVDGG